MFARLQLYAAAIAGIALAFVAAYFGGVARGKDKIKRDLDEHALETMRTAKEIDDEIENLDDSELSTRARSWVRSDNG